MPEPILFSIVIPTFNREKLIQRTIQSVLNQSYENFELIIVDDGGTDNTSNVVASFKDSRIKYLHKKNEERGVARNAGMEMSTGQYLTFVDSDDTFYEYHLQHAFDKIQKLNFPDFYRQGYEVRDINGKLFFANNSLEGDANEFILKGNYFSCIGVFLKKEVTDVVRFSTERMLCPSEDWDYWLRLSVRYKFYYDNRITACMLQHNERSLNNFQENRSRLTIALLIKSLRNDYEFMAKRGHYLDQIRAQMYSLLCLNKVIHGSNKGLRRDLQKTLKLSKNELFRRRGLAILKYYILNLIKVK
ncbi:MAG: glycosyltransferase [Opitutaceae bacterium]|nr:glycosyltransferase [Cytophagales bacterium]